MNTKLKPCPFCGTKVEMTKTPLWNGSHGYQGCYRFGVTCEKCGCTLRYIFSDTIYRTEEDAINNVIDAWNKREDETAVPPQPKTGHWHIINRGLICSNCDKSIFKYHKLNFDYKPKYCPNCGAKMEVDK